MRYRSLLLTVLLACTGSPQVLAQLSQHIKGRVTDKESRMPLEGAVVQVLGSGQPLGGITNASGWFDIAGVPLGKYTIQCSYVGYQTQTIPNVLLRSGHEVVLQISLEESAGLQIEEVEVRASRHHINEMALLSARSFDVQETERFAGSRADPARMASNFAGVQGADDSRNDIIIRGNTPLGLLWRIEELDVPNPNHFAIPGTTGGPISMLNNKTLANSDFFTGAFPAAYGNAVAGVFDLKLRPGNPDRYEMSAQLGFLGTELAAEGPLSRKSGATFLATYRYSTLQLFEGLKIPIGTNSVPNYQDASIRLHFPLSNKMTLGFWAIGGLSNIDLIVSKLSEPSQELYGEDDRDQYFYSHTGMGGASLSYTLSSRTFMSLSVGQTYNVIGAHHDKVFRGPAYRLDSLKLILGYRFGTASTLAHWFVNHKMGARHTLRAGLMNNLYTLDLTDSSRQYPPSRQDWQHRLDFQGNTSLMQAYVQYKYRPSDQLTLTAGLHAQYLTHNQSQALEPRLALRWYAGNRGIFSIGYGLHSQMQPLYQYFTHLPQYPAGQMHNYELGFTRSHHLVGGYERALGRLTRLRSEVYYQYLFDVPVELKPGSSFSGINQGASFSRVFPDTLVNAGTGYNYGLELSVERSFGNGYYILFTGSVFDSKARGQDGVYRSTDYNSRYALNLLAGYERKLGQQNTLITGLKVTYAGGRLYSPADKAASNAMGDLVVIESERNTLQFDPYFRADLKLGLRFNRPRLTHELALDLVNITDQKNVLGITYSPDLASQGRDPFIRQYQLGFLPLFYYKVDFGWGRPEPARSE